MRLPRWLGALAAVGVTAVMLTGCGAAPSPVPDVIARQFTQAVANENGAGACGLLAPATRAALEQSAGTPCVSAIVEENLPYAGALETSATFGTMTQVSFSSDVVFLAEFPRGWRVMAAGCAPGTTPETPYQCQLSGG